MSLLPVKEERQTPGMGEKVAPREKKLSPGMKRQLDNVVAAAWDVSKVSM
jgi:hypothetical protein